MKTNSNFSIWERPCDLQLKGVNEYGFEVYQSAYFKLWVEPMDSSFDRYREHYGVFTVWVKHFESDYQMPVIIQKKGFMYVPIEGCCSWKKPTYTSYQSKNNRETGFPEYVMAKIKKLIRDIRRTQPQDGAKQLVKKWLSILDASQARVIQAELTHRKIHLTFLDAEQSLVQLMLYEQQPNFPCDLETAVELLNEVARKSIKKIKLN